MSFFDFYPTVVFETYAYYSMIAVIRVRLTWTLPLKKKNSDAHMVLYLTDYNVLQIFWWYDASNKSLF